MNLDYFYKKFDFQSDFLFDGFNNMEKLMIKSQMEFIEFSKGQRLFYEGGSPSGVFFLKEGKAKKFKSGINNEHQIFYIYSKGDLLGYHAVLGKERYEDSCEALERCVVGFIRTPVFDELRKQLKRLNELLIKNLGHEFGVLANIIGVMAQNSLNSRLAIFLLILENKYRDNVYPRRIEMSRENLANMIGTSRESLGRSLKEFRDKGYIQIQNKGIEIVDRASLINVSGVQIPDNDQPKVHY